jgi:hypothetical protein
MAQGALRRVEARIGQLLGPAHWGDDRQVHHDGLDLIHHREDRRAFRLFARAIERGILVPDDWLR